MNLICAVDREWNIGKDNKLLFHIREDLIRFKEITMGEVVVMGKNTFISLPNIEPLENRVNIVLTRDMEFSKEGVIVCNDLIDLDKIIEKKFPNNEIFLIGGGNLVFQLLNKCKFAFITKVNEIVQTADTKIPNLDKMENWKLISQSKSMKDGDMSYKYVKYERID